MIVFLLRHSTANELCCTYCGCDVCRFDLLLLDVVLLFFKQKTADEMRISDWSSDVCSSDLLMHRHGQQRAPERHQQQQDRRAAAQDPRKVRGTEDRKRVVQGKSVSVRVDIGGRRNIKNKNQLKRENYIQY